MTIWFQDMGLAVIMHVGRHSDRILNYVGASAAMETVMEYFTVRVRWPKPELENEPYRLKLSPLFERIAKRIQTLDVEVDSQRFIPVRLRYVEPSGDETEFLFSDVQINEAILPERFELQLPPDVEVRTRP